MSPIDDFLVYLQFKKWIRKTYEGFEPLAVEFALWQDSLPAKKIAVNIWNKYMTKIESSNYKNVTTIDLEVAIIYYPILVGKAKSSSTVTYGELVQSSKDLHPYNTTIQKTIPASIGRRLDVVRIFTNERSLPDVTSLVINASTKMPSQPRLIDVQSSVFAFDWTNVKTEFDGFIERTKMAIKPRKKVKENEALQLMSEYYQVYKNSLPASVRERRELIIEFIMEGFSVEDSFSQAMAA